MKAVSVLEKTAKIKKTKVAKSTISEQQAKAELQDAEIALNAERAKLLDWAEEVVEMGKEIVSESMSSSSAEAIVAEAQVEEATTIYKREDYSHLSESQYIDLMYSRQLFVIREHIYKMLKQELLSAKVQFLQQANAR